MIGNWLAATALPTNIYYGKIHMTTLATTIDEFFDLTKDKFQDSKYHHLPLVFANMFHPDKNSLIIAKGKTRNNIQAVMANLRSLLSKEMGHITYEPNYGFLKSHENKSIVRFDTTGFHGGRYRAKHMKNLDTILLYGFEAGKSEWEELYKIAMQRSIANGTRILVHYA
jgi:hypothetical protein